MPPGQAAARQTAPVAGSVQAAAGQTAVAAASGQAAPVLPGADLVVVTIDTLRADATGFAGNRRAQTPILDRLAAGGRVFTNAHAQTVVTLPSHTSILTGLYPYQHGVRENSGFKLAPTVPTLATLLRRAGYATGAFVAAFPLDSRFGLAQGFDVYDDRFPRGANADEFLLAERKGDEVVRLGLDWWRRQQGRRRFLWLHLYEPHAPYEPPEPFAGRFRDNPYLGEVAAADSYLAPLVEPFLAGREPPALVIVTGDHGEALGDHGELTHGLFAYEATLEIPLVAWWPGARPGRDGRLARHVDVVPTVLATLGLEVPPGLPGRSLLAPPAASGAPDQEASSYFEALSTHLNRGWAPLHGILLGHYKLIELPLPELYDLAADPREERNLFAREGAVARRLAAAMPPAALGEPRQAAVSAEEAARLRSLGYGSAGGSGSGGPRGSGPGGAFTAADDPKRLIGLDRKLHQVIDLYSRRRYAEGAALARQAVAERPSMSEAYELLALCLRQQEQVGEAIKVLAGARARGVRGDALSRQLGESLAEAGRPEEAVAVLRPLASGDDPTVVQDLGIALSDGGHHEEAIAILEKAVRRFPQDPRGYENLGIVALRRGHPDEAKRHLEKALAMNARLPFSWNSLGVALYQLRQPDAALEAWHRAFALDPTQYDALYNLGLVAAELGRRDEARKALATFIATAPHARFAPDIAKAQARLQGLGG
jgi:arylsulfatase A-like enzyme/Flp pilus assembly protein TadD